MGTTPTNRLQIAGFVRFPFWVLHGSQLGNRQFLFWELWKPLTHSAWHVYAHPMMAFLIKWIGIALVAFWAGSLLYGLIVNPKYILLLLILVIGLVCMVLKDEAENEKTRNIAAFILLGMLYGLFILPVVVLLVR